MTDLEREVAKAIESAYCPGREGPFGGYDYGHNPAFYGPAPEAGRYVVRDFRDPSSSDWGKWVHQTHDRAEHERTFAEMTAASIARAAIAVVVERAAQACEQQVTDFLSPQYATGQPLSSFGERFACGRCADSIRALAASEEVL